MTNVGHKTSLPASAVCKFRAQFMKVPNLPMNAKADE